MIIIVVAMVLMRVSFVHDVAPQNLNYLLYLSEQNPVPISISANTNDSSLLDSISSKMSLVYGTQIRVDEFIANSDIIFDQQYLFPLKSSTPKLRGAIYYQSQQTVSGITLLPFTSIINTKTPTSVITVQTLAA